MCILYIYISIYSYVYIFFISIVSFFLSIVYLSFHLSIVGLQKHLADSKGGKINTVRPEQMRTAVFNNATVAHCMYTKKSQERTFSFWYVRKDWKALLVLDLGTNTTTTVTTVMNKEVDTSRNDKTDDMTQTTTSLNMKAIMTTSKRGSRDTVGKEGPTTTTERLLSLWREIERFTTKPLERIWSELEFGYKHPSRPHKHSH